MARQIADSSMTLDGLFRPRSVAVIGASQDPNRIGGRPVRYLKTWFEGAIYPVNRSGGEVQGLTAYPSVAAIGRPVDLALLTLPADAVPPAIEDCARAGVRAAVVMSSGFAEAGPEGRRRQRRLTVSARAAGMRLLGPNCLGLMNVPAGLFLTFTIAVDADPPRSGNIGIVSQSGAFAAHAYALAHKRGLGLSAWISTGNEADVDLAECLAYLADDPATGVIMAYMEGCRDGSRLIAALERARANRKPVVVVKVGRSEAGRAAAVTHTAAMTGSDRVFEAVLARHGAHRARDIDEFFDVAYAASRGRFPRDRRIGIAGISGGVNIFMADRAAERGLEVTALPRRAQAALASLLPNAGVRNPVDVTAQILNDPTLLTRAISEMLTEGGIESLALFLTMVTNTPDLRDRFMAVFDEVRRRFPHALLALCTMAPPDVRRRLDGLGYLMLDEPARVVDAIAALAGFADAFRRRPPRRRLVRRPPWRLAPGPVGEHAAKRLLSEAGIPALPERLATTAAAAVGAARALGLPVAMKIASPDIPHKTEIGGVLLDVASAAGVRRGFSALAAAARRTRPGARIDGVLVAPMARGGVEMILGARRDATFGPVVMVGLGGIFAEALDDVALGIAPVSPVEAGRMIRSLKGLPLLAGARGRPPADIDALARALARLSEVAAANADTVESIDINPMLVLPRGRGAVAVDALIVPVA